MSKLFISNSGVSLRMNNKDKMAQIGYKEKQSNLNDNLVMEQTWNIISQMDRFRLLELKQRHISQLFSQGM